MRPLISWKRSLRAARDSSAHDRDIMLVKQVRGHRFPRLVQFFHLPKIASPKERRLLTLGVCLISAGMVTGLFMIFSAYRVQTPAVGGRYVEGVVGSPQLVNPIFSGANDVDMDLVHLLYSGLLRYDKHQRLVPDIAARYDVSEDKKIYVFELRHDVLWHDEEPLTAKDVAFTIETIQHTAVGSPLFVSFQGVAVDVVDDYTIRFTLQEPFLPFLSTLTTGIIPEHIWGDVPADQVRLAGRNLQPIGSGPYQFERISKDDTGFITSYELRRFDRYYREQAFIEEFAFQFYREYDGPEGAIQALREKKADGLDFVPYALRERVERKHVQLHTLQLPQYTALFFNQKEEPALQNNDIRIALAFALDRDRIVRESIKGEGQVIEGPVLPGFPGYLPDMAKTPYDVTEANKKLDAASERIPADSYRAIRAEALVKERIAALSATSTSSEISTSTLASSTEAFVLTEEMRQSIEDDIKQALD
ncbi:MAG: ABC transporter substrate-binding protein, partial [Patescibacteria group bacterium]